jgi:hypothetical protein
MQQIQVHTWRGAVPCVHWEAPEPRGEIAIVLPGARFGCGAPPTAYATLVLQARGSDVLWVEYAFDRRPGLPRAELEDQRRSLGEIARAAVDTALHLGGHERHVLVGKSLGTLAMASLLAESGLPSPHRTVWLTPLLREERVRGALEQLGEPGLLVIGDDDPEHDPVLLERLANRGVCRTVVLQGANHGLNVGVDAGATLAAMQRYVRALDVLLGAPPDARLDAR